MKLLSLPLLQKFARVANRQQRQHIEEPSVATLTAIAIEQQTVPAAVFLSPLPQTQEIRIAPITKPKRLQESWDGITLSTGELDVFSMENTLRLEAMPPAPTDLPNRRDETTGLEFVRTFIRSSDNVLDAIENTIRKALRKAKDPTIVYMHSSDYQMLCQEYFDIYHLPLNRAFQTNGLYHRPIEVLIYLADQMQIDLPRGVLICQ